MTNFHVAPGCKATFRKTVGESDVYLFAGITGDLPPNHVDETVMAGTRYGGRIAHGALIVGFMSNASSRILEGVISPGETAVSLGYDRIRFVGAVMIGDTIEVTYEIVEVDAQARRSMADISVINQRGEMVAVARHILKWVKNET